MKEPTALLKRLWGLTPLLLSFGPVFLWMGLSAGDASNARGAIGSTMLVLGLLSVYLKVREIAFKLNLNE